MSKAMVDHYAVMGNPVAHSLSPQIHQYFAESTGQIISYEPALLSTETFLKEARNLLRNLKGANITAPFKLPALELADIIDPRAVLAKATNTLIVQADKIIADNTDGIGLATDLIINQRIELKQKKILIIGAGGAAHGITHALKQFGPYSITITNRHFARALNLAKSLQHSDYDFEPFAIAAFASAGHTSGQAIPVAELSDHTFDLIINATSQLPELPKSFSANHAICYDLNYSSNAYDFANWSKENSASRYINGIGMLVEQAAAAFYLWHGIHPTTSKIIAKLTSAQG